MSHSCLRVLVYPEPGELGTTQVSPPTITLEPRLIKAENNFRQYVDCPLLRDNCIHVDYVPQPIAQMQVPSYTVVRDNVVSFESTYTSWDLKEKKLVKNNLFFDSKR